MKSKSPTPDLYLAFPKAIAALRDRLQGTTSSEVACWLFFGHLKAYGHVHEFPEPPEFNLSGIALNDWPNASKENPPFIHALEGAFFLIDDVNGFNPPARFIAYEELLQRWIPYRENRESTASFIHSRIHQSRLHDFTPWLGSTELSRVFFPSLPDDCKKARPPAEWAMFDLSQVMLIEATDFPNAAINLKSELASPAISTATLSENDAPPDQPKSIDNLQDESLLDIEGERGCRRRILEHWGMITNLHPNGADARQVHRFINRNRDPDQKELDLKTVQNRLIDLRNEKKIP